MDYENVMVSKKTDTKRKNFRVLYPVVKFYLTLEGPREFDAFIYVKSNIENNNNFEVLGKTDTILNSSVLRFPRPIRVLYLAGINDNQSIIFEIYDNDKMSLGEGYLFASVQVFIVDILISPTIPVRRGNDILGFLKIKYSSLELKSVVSTMVIFFFCLHSLALSLNPKFCFRRPLLDSCLRSHQI